MSNEPVQSADEKDILTNKYKVRLVAASRDRRRNTSTANTGNTSQKKSSFDVSRVVFDVTPDLSESRTVNYKTMNPIHMPGQIFAYGATNSRTFNLSGVKLISRTIAEATKNMKILWALRGWAMPYFGEQSSVLSNSEISNRSNLREGKLSDEAAAKRRIEKVKSGVSLLGKPPDVLYLTAYSGMDDLVSTGEGRKNRPYATNIANVPVVMTNLSIPYPSDVDYIPTENGEPFPRVMSLDIQLQETRAPEEFTKLFNIQDFRQGLLSGF